MQSLFRQSLNLDYQKFFQEDGVLATPDYFQNLPKERVTCELKIKSDLLLSGIGAFFGVFDYLTGKTLGVEIEDEHEGQMFRAEDGEQIEFDLPFHVALTGERIALNLLHRSSAISTETSRFVEKAEKYDIQILDTRKTVPGFRCLDKYAVKVGGGGNHRFSQTDAWMIKDNHKMMFGGLKPAWKFFRNKGSVYQPIIAEIHDLLELEEAMDLGIQHLMLDNFSPWDVAKAIEAKAPGCTYEVSGGINLTTIEDYLQEGVDFISVGSLTNFPPPVDISLKMRV